MPASEAQKAAWSMKPKKAPQRAPQRVVAPLDPPAVLRSPRLERLIAFRLSHPATFAALSDETRQEVADYETARARDQRPQRPTARPPHHPDTAMRGAAR